MWREAAKNGKKNKTEGLSANGSCDFFHLSLSTVHPFIVWFHQMHVIVYRNSYSILTKSYQNVRYYDRVNVLTEGKLL